MLNGLAAAAASRSPIKRSEIRHTLENDALLPCGPQIIQPPVPVVGPPQLYAVESCRGCELPLLENSSARKDVLPTRQLHAVSPTSQLLRTSLLVPDHGPLT